MVGERPRASNSRGEIPSVSLIQVPPQGNPRGPAAPRLCATAADAGQSLATLDRYTYDAFTTGEVTLPGRRIHASVWLALSLTLVSRVTCRGDAVPVRAQRDGWRGSARPVGCPVAGRRRR